MYANVIVKNFLNYVHYVSELYINNVWSVMCIYASLFCIYSCLVRLFYYFEYVIGWLIVLNGRITSFNPTVYWTRGDWKIVNEFNIGNALSYGLYSSIVNATKRFFLNCHNSSSVLSSENLNCWLNYNQR